jgi:site-specific DNA-cytosine methylase
VVEPNIIKEGNYHKSCHNASSIVNPKGISPTVMENHDTVTATVEPLSCRIRKLTPRECFRLMDCDDEVIDKIQEAGISNSQQYKLAGNSIVVNVLYNLFRKLFTETENEENQLTLF